MNKDRILAIISFIYIALVIFTVGAVLGATRYRELDIKDQQQEAQAIAGWQTANDTIASLFSTSTIVYQYGLSETTTTISCYTPFVITYHFVNVPSFGKLWFDTCSRPEDQWITN